MRLARLRGKWCAVWYEDGRRYRVSLRTADRDLAEQRLADLEAQQESPRETVRQIVEAYLEAKRNVVADHARLCDAWKAVQTRFQAYRPDQVTKELCKEHIDARLRQGRSPGTINKELSVLRSALRWHDPRTPAQFELLPAPPPRERYLTREEYARLLSCARSPHIELAIQLMLATAGRVTAILELTWSRVDFEKNRIILATGEPSAAKGRATVPMTPKLREALLEAQRAALSPYVVEYAGKRVLNIKKGFAAAARRADLLDVSPHVLRHTAAVWMAEAGVPMPVIAQYLGHRDDRITQRVYARFSPDYLAGAAAALEGC